MTASNSFLEGLKETGLDRVYLAVYMEVLALLHCL